ncbi:MAG: pyridoxamine 5'-phosphate oxidase family protein [Deltaproteobacteria bacterium]|nr:pyridoxamine 5'-phosphate oxidase family protein [Deltaproteobacteria bacterium]MBW1949111.1 pyridoxamine 5'-phosphate oxidase family protein [Deltaproteobacteria bacterium]MBW2008583.1 pyridoxamine 5'-phosphate oxidase family protein [Deltaproteobacteria bacterium]MBW2347631.1 pyridoxamine 5'-phosphate oxidase family protein [Deltaproteobacteria bacterium]
MRRSDREIRDRAEIDDIIRSSQVFRLSLSDNGRPYIVPLCFGYDGKALYFHCAGQGKKLDIIRKNREVCFEFDIVEGMLEAEHACDWGVRYRSVIGFGTALILEDISEKEHGLNHLMAHYANRSFSFPPKKTALTTVVKIEIHELTGKRSAP